MLTFLYTCPATGQRVQGSIDQTENQPGADYYQALECPACRLIHFVMPNTGKVMGEKGD